MSNRTASPPASQANPAGPIFDPDALRDNGFRVRVLQWLGSHPELMFAPLRLLRPNGRCFGDSILVTRYSDVREVLSNPDVFGVPYQGKIWTMAQAGFMLGTDDPAEYRETLLPATEALRLEDVAHLAVRAERQAEAIIADAPGRLDAASELVMPVLTRVCHDYYGIRIDQPRIFPLWTMASSAYLFAPLRQPDARLERQAIAAAAHLRDAVAAGIAHASARQDAVLEPGARPTVLDRLVARGESEATMRGIAVSFATATIPTGTIAACNMLEMLLRHPAMMRAAQAAAQAGDPELLRRCLFEALRFKAVAPFFPRDCARDYTLAAGTRRAFRVPRGARVLPCLQSAMFDPRQLRHPRRFDSDRPASDYMNFGHGMHACLAAALASSLIPAILRPLLLRERLAPTRGERPRLFGPFPEHFYIRFELGARQ